VPSARNLVEGTAELRIPVAEQEAHPSPAFLQRQQKVPGLLGDPGAVGVGGHPAEVHPAGVQFDEEQHVEPFEPHGVDAEEVAGEDPGGLLTQQRSPRRARAPRGRVEATTT
jgi:hypothetical protein